MTTETAKRTIQERNEKIVQLADEGMSQRAIADKFAVSRILVRRALEAAKRTSARPGGGLVLVDLDLIDPNPWQPRLIITEAEVEGLADNIKKIGRLLQEPLLRPVDGGRYQSAFGHRRIEAVRLLRKQDQWGATIPVKVEGLSDEDMAYLALSENTERRDLSPAENIKAWRRALDEIEDITVPMLAEKVGIDRTTMIKDLAILSLPDSVIELVHAGTLSVRGARELLCLQTDTHSHDDMIDLVLADCGKEDSYGFRPVDFRVKTVRKSIKGLASGSYAREYNSARENSDRLWRRLDARKGDNDAPSFDVDAFKNAYSGDVHLLPEGDTSGGRYWTCNVKAWRSWSSKATGAANKARAEGKAPEKAQGRNATASQSNKLDAYDRWLQAVKADPVVSGLLGDKRTDAIKDPTEDLTEDERLRLGTRILPVKLENEGTWNEGYNDDHHVLPPTAYPFDVDVARVRDRGDTPPAFDFSQCANCVNGASWATPRYGQGAVFICTNNNEWMDKRSRGIEAFRARFDAQVKQEAEEDLLAVKHLAAMLTAEWGRVIVWSHYRFLFGCDHIEGYANRQNWPQFNYWPATALEWAELVGVELPVLQAVRYGAYQTWEEGLREFLKFESTKDPADFDWPRAAALTLVWQARAVGGHGTPMVARATKGVAA